MAERRSALAGQAAARPTAAAADDDRAVRLYEVPVSKLWQIAAWPDTRDAVGTAAADTAGVADAPGAGRAALGADGDAVAERALLRRAPLVWWLYGADAPALDAGQGVTLDLSHAFTQIALRGPGAATLLNRHLPLDLRERAFPQDAVAGTAFHHVGVTLWRRADGYRLFVPRSFALALWQLLRVSAAALDT